MNLVKKLFFPTLALLIVFVPVLASGGQKALKKKESPQSIGARDINKGQINFYSPEKELEMGKRMAADVERRSKLLNDPVILEVVNRITQNIAINSDTKMLMRVKVIDSSEINAFALPGGFLYVNRGLIEAADNEAELAGVIAHEVAHVAARHGVEQMTKSDIVDMISMPMLFLGGRNRGKGNLGQAAGMMIPMLFLKFSRNAEREADRLAAQYLWKTGYDPNALITFFEKLQKQEKKAPGSMPRIFRTHPMNKDRIEDTRELLARFPRKNEYQLNSTDFLAVKDMPGIKRYKWDIAESKKDKRRKLKRRKRDSDNQPDPEERERPTLKTSSAETTQVQDSGPVAN